MKNVTRAFSTIDMDWLENHPSERANEIGKRKPYHLQYVKDGKVNVKPEEKTDEAVLQQQQ